MNTNELITTQMTADKINTVEDVRNFVRTSLQKLKLAFHPDNQFEDYVCCNGENTFTDEESAILTDSLSRCFDVCHDNGADIYEICREIERGK